VDGREKRRELSPELFHAIDVDMHCPTVQRVARCFGHHFGRLPTATGKITRANIFFNYRKTITLLNP
jgi:hypothetical protein